MTTKDNGVAPKKINKNKKPPKNGKDAKERLISSLLAAIRKHCLECSGGKRSEVENCFLEECSLHKYRMGTVEKTKKDR